MTTIQASSTSHAMKWVALRYHGANLASAWNLLIFFDRARPWFDHRLIRDLKTLDIHEIRISSDIQGVSTQVDFLTPP